YSRRVQLRWAALAPAAACGFVASLAGAWVVTMMSPTYLRMALPFILVAVLAYTLVKKDMGRHHTPRFAGNHETGVACGIGVLLVAVAIYTYSRKNLGHRHAPKFLANHERLFAILVGVIIGFYDGFFGPGTGAFLIFIFIGFFGFDFLTASASAKAINFATNLAAVIAFAAAGQVLYDYALPMGACNVAGAIVGTRLAMLKGNQFVRLLFLAIVGVLIVRFGSEQVVK
ncbi:MAG: TSUP family transporter, partial [Akkermansiaceae bacterium]|nr:TSUP family transporter [Verrucomicrobiales bacterium]